MRTRWFLLLAVAVLMGAMTGAAPARAEILLQEDFEDGNLAARGWYDVARWGTELFHSTTEHRNGNGSLEVRYSVGSTGPWMRHQFSGRDRVYTRYYRKWAANWQWANTGPHDTYIFGMYGQQYFPPTQTQVTVYTEGFYQGLPDWQPGSIGLTTRRYLQGESYRTMTSINPPPPRYQLDRWYCIETLASMNTPGSSDGRIQVWVDGAARFDIQNVELRNAANAALQFDQWMFGPYYHGGAPQVQSTWIDALVVATERVGCLGADTDPPSAPSLLRRSP